MKGQAKRPSWDQMFTSLAWQLAERSTCDRLHVGCVLVRDNRIIATGYNGSLAGAAHCDDVGHLMHEGHCIRTVHAEANAITDCSKRGVTCQGAVAYVTHTPCHACMKLVIAAGIRVVKVAAVYQDLPLAKWLAAEGRIKLNYIGDVELDADTRAQGGHEP